MQKRGHYLEPAILEWWSDQHVESYPDHSTWSQPTYTLGDWAAATPDMAISPLAPKVEGVAGRKILAPTALVEAKSANSLDEWGTPGTDEIPLHYLLQCQWQLHLSGAHRCHVPVLGPRLEFVEYVVDYLPDEGPVLERRMRAFYDSLSADVPPELDDSVATYNAVRKVHKDIDRGESVELTKREARDLVLWTDELKSTEAGARRAKSVVIDRMARAQYATYDGVRIARRQYRTAEATSFVVVAKPEDLPEENAA